MNRHDHPILTPDQPHEMIYWDRPSEHVPPGICLAVSPDGYTWNPLPSGPVIRNANDAASLINPHPIQWHWPGRIQSG